ncbi:MAG TPA: L,D-transpeptidase family protein [Longimicrobiales bacterium]|nr:L,D-transpeptidase family protein [Longimicrobiales bacterium]
MTRLALPALLWTLLLPAAAGAQAEICDAFGDALRNRIEAGRATGGIVAAGDPIMAMGALPRFYEERAFRSAWFRGERPMPEVGELLSVLRSAVDEGLRPGDYHLPEIDALLRSRSADPEDDLCRRVDAELLLTDAFLVYASHLLQGRVNPERIEPEWIANRRGTDFAVVLADALDGRGISAAFDALEPREEGYRLLRAALTRLRAVARSGGWPRVPGGESLRAGMEDPRVEALRRRLEASGDLPILTEETAASDGASDALFDERLAEGLRRFQRRHGLEPDGVAGEGTLRALNVPVEERIDQVELNMERWRWLPEELGRRHIRVNIAGFGVDVWEDGAPVRRIRAIVGRAYRQTPIFTGRMTYLVFSPFWHVPPGIAVNDKLPAIKRDPGYVAAQRMTLLDARTNEPVDPSTVEWSEMTGSEFNRRFRLRQEPGPWNALGTVKFMFPNRHNVYLHDTPDRGLFGRTERSFSSGCVRIEEPIWLAEYLLRGDPRWTRERIDGVIAGRREVSVILPEPVPVHVLYWTAWVDEDGVLQFRRDLYDRDAAVRRALEHGPPGP